MLARLSTSASILPIPPPEMRALVGPTDPAAFDNPSHGLVYPYLRADRYRPRVRLRLWMRARSETADPAAPASGALPRDRPPPRDGGMGSDEPGARCTRVRVQTPPGLQPRLQSRGGASGGRAVPRRRRDVLARQRAVSIHASDRAGDRPLLGRGQPDPRGRRCAARDLLLDRQDRLPDDDGSLKRPLSQLRTSVGCRSFTTANGCALRRPTPV